ncbi:efflux RND transporter permease subunit [Flavobacterium sp. xlx-214]|uniref:efflux RND transporter permease subunit n=1 Tax=unclassified Flavobacterium TaxID=196869 RepID=UPI0013D5E1FE|nr:MULTISPECIES: efflux RND transporter permease subunit [unclassified Flavobacterium]MBA5791158.1 efflux RND transporter permease subunit [Flavobacterium sp. xlx-221]QMI83672.1 efflux RND transporter permease subunit [Flavobacterium sp. xlx-214]
MNLIKFALQKPIAIMVLVLGLLFFGVKASKEIKVDILPEMDLPVVYIAHSFNGYTPQQMEGYFTKMYVNMMLFTNGVKSIESKNTQGLTLMKVTFYEGTEMGEAIATVNALSNRSQVFLPPGAPPPFIIRFDASSQPVGQLVFRSNTKTNNELQDIANFNARPFLIKIPGLTTAPPFGGSPRTIEVNIDPYKLRAHNLSPEQIVEAISRNNITSPSGNVYIGDKNYLTPTNNTVKHVEELGDIPIFKGTVDNVYIKDVATVKDGADIATGYALIDGKRSVYINIAKAGNASTLDVVNKLKKELPNIQRNMPDDVQISYEFDQSVYITNALKSLIIEGVLGALLTGLMVMLFLNDRRAAIIVILTIPISIISGVLFLKLFGQTINIMSLSGLALAIGILVDESTVTIENIHQHFAMGKTKAQAIWDACKEIAFPKLLIMLCILAVFAPAFMMTGIPGSLFMPLAMAIGCSMIVSFLLSQTFVPVLANWMMKHNNNHCENTAHKKNWFSTFTDKFVNFLTQLIQRKKAIVSIGLLVALIGGVALYQITGKDVLPASNSRQFQVRIKAAEGTRIEVTELKVKEFLTHLKKNVGEDNIAISSVFIGQHPSTFAVSPVYLYNAGPHEALMQVALKELKGSSDELKDQLRKYYKEKMPELTISFEPIELTEKILNQGTNTPIEVRISGMMKKMNRMYANKLLAKLKEIDYMRDQQIPQSMDYPAMQINIDRVRAAQLGLDAQDIAKSLVAATASTRYTNKNFWVGGMMGIAYDVQVQTPQNILNSKEELANLPLSKNADRPVLGDVATITATKELGESYNLGTMGYTTVTANLHKKDLEQASKDVQAAIASLGELPKGVNIEVAGMAPILNETLSSLATGLLIAVVVIFLMLSATFQSFRVSLVILSTVPFVVVGSLLMLNITGSTLNLQSYMGLIMSVGVSIANAVLLISNAETLRKQTNNAVSSSIEAAKLRIRPIVMTTLAMIAGMLPMAIGFGEGGDQVAPLGRAVIGGLLFSTVSVLVILPLVFSWLQKSASILSPSLDPEDEDSIHFIKSN